MRKILFLLFCFGNIVFVQSQISISDAINVGKQISKNGNTSTKKLNRFWFSTGEIEFIVSNDVEYNYGTLDNNGNLVSGKKFKSKRKSFLWRFVFNKLSYFK